MKFTHITMRPIVCKLMTEMSLLDRPATPDEIVKIVQAVLAEAEGRKPEPLAPKLVVPEDPDEASAMQALFTVMRPVMLTRAVRMIPNSDCYVYASEEKPYAFILSTFAHQDQIRQVLTEFGVCPARRKRRPYWATRPGSCTLRMRVPLPGDWRLSPAP